MDRVVMWEEGHVNRLRLLQDKPDPLSLLISHKLSTPTGLWSLLLSLYQKYFKRYHSTDIAMGILQILKEMGIPDHLICLLRNVYAGQDIAFDRLRQLGVSAHSSFSHSYRCIDHFCIRELTLFSSVPLCSQGFCI